MPDVLPSRIKTFHNLVLSPLRDDKISVFIGIDRNRSLECRPWSGDYNGFTSCRICLVLSLHTRSVTIFCMWHTRFTGSRFKAAEEHGLELQNPLFSFSSVSITASNSLEL